MKILGYLIHAYMAGLAKVIKRLPSKGQELTDLCSSCPRDLSIYFTNSLEIANAQGYKRCVDPCADETSCKYRWNGGRVDKKTGEKKRDCKK